MFLKYLFVGTNIIRTFVLMLKESLKLFAQEYVKDLDATNSYIRAGYSPKFARINSQKLLAKPEVQEYIKSMLKDRAERLKISADEVVESLVQTLRDDVRNYIEVTSIQAVNQLGFVEDKINIHIKDWSKIDTKNVQSIKIGKDGSFDFKLYDKNAAKNMLMKHLGAYEKDNKQKIVDADDLSKFTEEEMTKYLELKKKINS